MKRVSLQFAILLLIIAGCKTKTDSDNQTETAHVGQKETTRTIPIKAKPDTVAIDVSKTAVIIVDMQNDCVTGEVGLTGLELIFLRSKKLLTL